VNFIKYKAFTLAEVLVTLGILGVVSAMTIPTLVSNYQAKSLRVQWDTFHAKMIQVTRNMAVGNEFGPFSQTFHFAEKLPKYVKTLKICNVANFEECFASEIVNGDETIEVRDLWSSKSLGKDYDTENIAVNFVDGVSAIMSYKPECKLTNPYAWGPGDNPLDCLSLLVDLNGFSKPNEVGKDIITYGAQITITKIPTSEIPCHSTLSAAYGNCTAGKIITAADVDAVATDYTDLGSEYGATENGSKMTCALANKVCADNGMRLPSYLELNSMYNASMSGKLSGFVSGNYWATCDASKYRNCDMTSGNCGTTGSSTMNYVRCVK